MGDIAIDPRVAAACAELRATPGRPIAAVAAAVGLSPRQLRRRMRTEAGLGPRTLGRIARLQRFLALAEAGGPEATLARLAVTCGDADQPHLTREVRRLAGLPPAELLRERSRTGA